jgi:hypothetical protein
MTLLKGYSEANFMASLTVHFMLQIAGTINHRFVPIWGSNMQTMLHTNAFQILHFERQYLEQLHSPRF